MTDDHKSLVPRPATVEWYYEHDGAQIGPISEEQLVAAAKRGDIGPDTLVWRHDQDEWIEAGRIPRIAFLVGPITKPLTSDRTSSLRSTDHPKNAPAAEVEEPLAEPTHVSNADESLPQIELHDAVAEEEAVEATVDPAQVRQILERTSRFPLAYAGQVSGESTTRFPSERWVPPASVATNPPPATTHSPLGMALRIGRFAAPLLLVGAAVLLVLRQQAVPLGSASTTARGERATPAALGADSARTDAARIEVPGKPAAASETPAQRPPAQAEEITIESGPLDAEALSKRVARALRVFEEQCWTVYRVPVGPVTKDPAVRIEMTVDRAGRVRSIEASKSPQGYKGVGPCIMGRMRGWRFPKAEEESRAVVIVRRPSH